MDDLVLFEVAAVLQTQPTSINLSASFIYNGGNSLSAAALATKCRARGCSLTLRSIMTSLSLKEVIESASTLPGTELTIPTIEEIPRSSELTPPLSLTDSPPKDKVSELALLLDNGTDDPSSQSNSMQKLPSIKDLVRSNPRSEFSKLGFVKAQQMPYTPADTPKLSSTPTQEESPFRSSTPDQPIDFEDGVLTQMQLALIHGSMKTPGMNIITHAATFHSKDIPLMKLAWRVVIEQESIFNVKALLPESGKPFNWYDPNVDEDKSERRAHIALHRGQVGSFFEVVHHEPVSTAQTLSTIIWRVHHALIDGYSAYLLFDKVRNVVAGRTVEPSPPFLDVVQDFKLLQQARQEEGKSFWAEKLSKNGSARANLLLPSMDEQLEHEHSQSAEKVIELGSGYEKLHSFARETNVTPAVIFNAAWALVLSMYTDSDTVVFGAVLSGRDLPIANATAVIGPLVNTLPFFVSIPRDYTVEQFLRMVLEDMIELREYQWTTPENGYSRDFESAVAVQTGQPASSTEYVESVGRTHTQQNTEIPLSIVIEGDGTLRLNYHSTRFSRQNMERLSSCYFEAIQLLMQTSSTIDTVLSGLLPAPSRAMLTAHGNCLSGLTTRTSIKHDLVTLYESSVRKNPNDPAVERGQVRLTYREFDEAATKVMTRLQTKVAPGDIVCVHSDRSINWIVAIFGILKAGAVYCSLNSDLPLELRSTMYASAGAKVYLTPSSSQQEHRPISCDSCWAVDSILEEHTGMIDSFDLHRKQAVPWTTAYLCFTSGSTGTPKGVVCTHEGLVAFQNDLVVRLNAQPGIKISQIMSPAFDGSIHEIFSALTHGASLVLQIEGDPFGHLASVDSAILTPSMARVLNPRDYERLKNVYLVGEPVPQLVSEKWSALKQLYNMYGPTEGTCGATIKHLTPGSPVTIGPPNPTTRVYILDSRQSLVPLGTIGEIYLGGVQVAKGYLNLEEQTRERFLPDSIFRNGEQMYKTGDRGYWNEMGEVVCLGRNDRQIKLRGYRLDMNDLEIRIMRAAPQLEAIAIAPRGDQLVAMVQPAYTDIQALRARISSVLPSYAIMQQIMPIAQIPVTSTGKVDYKAVTQMAPSSSARQASSPETVTEKAIAAVFRSVLKLDENTLLTTESDFVHLGGHSLLQLSMTSRLTKVFGIRIPLRLIIENPTIGDMARCVDKFKTSTKPALPRGQSLAAQQVSPIEREWLQKYDIDSGSACFNVCYASTFDPKVVNRSALASAWNTVLARHKLFRGRYVTRKGREPTRVEAETAPLVERVSDLNLWTEANRPFHVHQGSPVRVFVTRNRLIVVMSHIIADYTALSIVLKEASTVYNGQQLGPIGKVYPNSSVWYDSVPPCYLEFWTHYLEDYEINRPLLGKQQERTKYCGTSSISRLSSNLTKKMLDYSDRTKLSLQQFVMAVVALCLQIDMPETDIVLGSPYINRNSDDDLEMMGLFLEPLPVRIKYPDPLPKPPMTEGQDISFLDSVQKSSQSALAHVVPWHQLLEHLGITPGFPNHPLFDVMVTFHDYRHSMGLGMAAPGFESCFLWSEGAKFKLMFEFTAISDDKLLLRIEYDTGCFSEEDIDKIEAILPKVLELLVDGETHQEIKCRIKKEQGRTCGHQRLDVGETFGKKLCDL